MQTCNASTETVLPLQEEGLQAFTQYLRKLTAQRAQDSYTSLVEGGPRNPLSSPPSLCLLMTEAHLHDAVFPYVDGIIDTKKQVTSLKMH